MPLDEEIGKEIVRMRKELKYSYQEIAEKLRNMGFADISKDTVRRYYKDYAGPSSDKPSTQRNMEIPSVPADSAPADLDKSAKPGPRPDGNMDINNIRTPIARKENTHSQNMVKTGPHAITKDISQETKKEPVIGITTDSKHSPQEIAETLRANWEDWEERRERERDGEKRIELKTDTGTWLILILSIAFLVLVVLVVMWSNGDYGVFNAFHQVVKWLSGQ
jgi:hypothetical protein